MHCEVIITIKLMKIPVLHVAHRYYFFLSFWGGWRELGVRTRDLFSQQVSRTHHSGGNPSGHTAQELPKAHSPCVTACLCSSTVISPTLPLATATLLCSAAGSLSLPDSTSKQDPVALPPSDFSQPDALKLCPRCPRWRDFLLFLG